MATLNRARGLTRAVLWGYCERHLYGRHLHDGALWESRLVPDEKGSRP